MSERRIVVTKLQNRIKAIELMRKHKFTSVTHKGNISEYDTLQRVKNAIEMGMNYTFARKGFVSCSAGVAVCKI